MVVFIVPVWSPVLLAIAAGHGAVDLGRPTDELAPYLFVLLPVGSLMSTGAFLIASVLHFTDDLGPAGSVLLHAGVYVVDSVNRELASTLMMIYMVLLHVPLLIQRFLRDRMYGEVAVLALSLLGAIVFREFLTDQDGNFVFSEWKQRIVAAHVCVHDHAYAQRKKS